MVSNDEPDSSYGAARLAARFEARFETELVNPLEGFGDPARWIRRVGADALVLSGSDRSVLSELPWMLEEEEVLRNAVEGGVPTLAVCFGHQLLAKAFGAQIVTLPKRIGLFEVRPTVPDRMFAGLGETAVVPEQHSDQVSGLPDEFIVTATSSYCPVQAMRHRTRPVYGVQFHPCYDDGVFEADEAWMALDVPRPLSHDGGLLLGNIVALFAELVG